MAEIIRLRSNPHEAVQELLPWFVNGTLDEEELAEVEAHLAECAECSAELAAERRLAAAAVESAPVDSDTAWLQMKERLDAADAPQLRPAPPLWRKRVPIGWALASPVAAAAAVALVVVNLPARAPVETQFHALGAAQATAGANLVVQFQPGTRVADLQRLLETENARVVDGPTQTGAYLLRVDERQRNVALAQLRANRLVALAEPIDAPPQE